MAVSWSQLVKRHKKKRRAHLAVRSGAWKRVLPGVYVGADDAMTDWESKAQAALKWLPQGVLSHRAAAQLHGLEFGQERVEVTVPKKAGARSTREVTVLRSDVPWEDRTMLRGLRCTTLARTLFDLAPHIAFIDLAIAVEDAWREDESALLTLEKILGAKGRRGRPGASWVREVIEDCRSRGKPLRSALEVRMWWLLKESGLPLPVPGHPVEDEFGAMEIDFAWPDLKVALETDGKKFHPRERFDYDATRQSRLVALGWRVPRFTYAAIVFRPIEVLNLVSTALTAARTPAEDPMEIPPLPSGDPTEAITEPFALPRPGQIFEQLTLPPTRVPSSQADFLRAWSDVVIPSF